MSIKTNEEILKDLVESLDKFGKKLEKQNLYLPIYKEFEKLNIQQLNNDLNDSSKQFIRRNNQEDWEKILKDSRAKILDFIDFVNKEDEDNEGF